MADDTGDTGRGLFARTTRRGFLRALTTGAGATALGWVNNALGGTAQTTTPEPTTTTTTTTPTTETAPALAQVAAEDTVSIKPLVQRDVIIVCDPSQTSQGNPTPLPSVEALNKAGLRARSVPVNPDDTNSPKKIILDIQSLDDLCQIVLRDSADTPSKRAGLYITGYRTIQHEATGKLSYEIDITYIDDDNRAANNVMTVRYGGPVKQDNNSPDGYTPGDGFHYQEFVDRGLALLNPPHVGNKNWAYGNFPEVCKILNNPLIENSDAILVAPRYNWNHESFTSAMTLTLAGPAPNIGTHVERQLPRTGSENNNNTPKGSMGKVSGIFINPSDPKEGVRFVLPGGKTIQMHGQDPALKNTPTMYLHRGEILATTAVDALYPNIDDTEVQEQVLKDITFQRTGPFKLGTGLLDASGNHLDSRYAREDQRCPPIVHVSCNVTSGLNGGLPETLLDMQRIYVLPKKGGGIIVAYDADPDRPLASRGGVGLVWFKARLDTGLKVEDIFEGMDQVDPAEFLANIGKNAKEMRETYKNGSGTRGTSILAVLEDGFDFSKLEVRHRRAPEITVDVRKLKDTVSIPQAMPGTRVNLIGCPDDNSLTVTAKLNESGQAEISMSNGAEIILPNSNTTGLHVNQQRGRGDVALTQCAPSTTPEPNPTPPPMTNPSPDVPPVAQIYLPLLGRNLGAGLNSSETKAQDPDWVDVPTKVTHELYIERSDGTRTLVKEIKLSKGPSLAEKGPSLAEIDTIIKEMKDTAAPLVLTAYPGR